jgi:hypothetical protein
MHEKAANIIHAARVKIFFFFEKNALGEDPIRIFFDIIRTQIYIHEDNLGGWVSHPHP